jgi:hypothetical protein
MKPRWTLLVAAVALLAGACSGGDESGGVASLDEVVDEGLADVEPAAEVDPEQAMLELAACLRDNGIDIEDPTVDAEGNVGFGGIRGAAEAAGVDPESLRAAMDACVQSLEGVSLGRRGGDFDETEFQDTMLEFAVCMRANGYDMPDPDFSGTGPGPGGGGAFGELDRTDPDFMAAEEACGDILDGFRGPGGGRGGQGS